MIFPVVSEGAACHLRLPNHASCIEGRSAHGTTCECACAAPLEKKPVDSNICKAPEATNTPSSPSLASSELDWIMAYYALPQHTIDGMDHGAYLEVAHVAAEKASKNKGRLIHDHPAPADLISGFMASDLMSNPQHASVRPGSCANVIYTPPLPAPYPPCTSPLKDLRPITISDMRLETNHRGCSVMLRVLTPTGGLTALVAVVEDKRETAVMLQLYHQAEESVVPARELLRSGVCVVKEPFLTCATNGSYSVRVEHVSDIVWLENGDDSIPHKWRRPESATISDSTGIRKQGNEAVKHERWAEAELL